MSQQSNTQKQVNLREIFLGLQDQMVGQLSTNRRVIQHPTTKGDATEFHWLEMLGDYLPRRYCVDKAFVLDCEGKLSEQIDVVIYDRQYSPFLFNQNAAKYVPAESVYGVFEVKQELNSAHIRYAGEKAASVRRLRRTSAPVPHAGGTFAPKRALPRILAGILSLESGWSPPFGAPFDHAFEELRVEEQIDLGCVLRCGGFEARYQREGLPHITTGDKEAALIFFFLKLLSRLQEIGTVTALDFNVYSKAL